MDKLDLHKVVFVTTTLGEIPYFRADHYEVKNGLVIFYDGMNEVMYYNMNFIIGFGFGTR